MVRIISRSQISLLIARGGLAIVFIYAGANSLLHPYDWIGFIPSWLTHLSPLPDLQLIRLHSVAELVLGGLLFLGWLPRLVGSLAALDLAIILALNGINAITFRDVGLIALALTLIFSSKR